MSVEGDREALGIWWQDTEGAKFWLAVLNDLHRRGVQDVLIACVDGQQWGGRYPMIAEAWRRDWQHITPFLALPEDLRRVVYTTNTIEAMHRQIRKAIKTRGHFPDEQAATKLIYLAIERAETRWRSVRAWTSGLAALKIHFGDRLPD